MRKRSEIEKSGLLKDILIIEVLLDIRELLTPKKVKREKKTTRSVCE